MNSNVGEGVSILTKQSAVDTYDLWCLVNGETLTSVSDLSRVIFRYDIYPACHCVRIYIVPYSCGCALLTNTVHSYAARRLRQFAASLHEHRRQPYAYISAVPVIC